MKPPDELRSLAKSVLSPRARSGLVFAFKNVQVSLNRMTRGMTGKSETTLNPDVVEWLQLDGRNTFFGYHDKSPFSEDDCRVLACASRLHNRTPDPTSELSIGYFDLALGGRFIELGLTDTWCWQMGCMLQWLPGTSSERVIYNRSVDGRHGSAIVDRVDGRAIAEIPHPVYCVASTGKQALSLNFSRLHKFRPGYGYAGFSAQKPLEPNPEQDGIWAIDLEEGGAELVISLQQLSQLEPQGSMVNAVHYVNHLVYNPSATRFVFFHIWQRDNRRHIRMITARPDGSGVCLLTNEEFVSHFCWISDAELLAFAQHGGEPPGFYLYRDGSQERKRYLESWLVEDGHPSYSPSTGRVVVDTYPDRYGEQSLSVIEADGRAYGIGAFFTPAVRDAEFRCDLHPRWNRMGDQICVDAIHRHRRSMAIVAAQCTHE